MGLRALFDVGILGLLDLVLPEPAPAQPLHDQGPATKPKTVTLRTDHPVMRNEPRSSFLWLDLEDAEQQIETKLRGGLITREEAERLVYWSTNGYVVLPGCIPHDLIERALDDVDRVWNERRHVCIDILTDGRRTFVDEVDPTIRKVPHKLNDLYLLSPNALAIFMHPRIVRLAELIFDNAVIGCNSLTFEFGSQQPAHIDHVYMTPHPPRRLIASWIAMEDVRREAGPLQLWPGSHRLPPYDFGGDSGFHYKPELESQHTSYVADQKERFPRSEFIAKKGDVLLWHAFFVHGGGTIEDPRARRRSMACHYFSGEGLPTSTAGLKAHGNAYYMTKGVADPV
jgi:ectoine hydroxylase-related dioxygenase (phytanoyl-CoA dioxygenase family)